MKKLTKFIIIIILIITLSIAYARYIGTTGLITKEYKIETHNISNSFSGLKIVHFSDLHYLRIVNKEELQKVVNEINIINPDIVFFTGDLIDKDYDLSDSDKENLINLLNSINSKYGKYSVIGNHDYVKEESLIKEIYENSNFKLLKNDYDIIYSSNNDKIFIGGTDTFSYDKADIDKVMEYFKEKEDISYKIILAHEPDYIDTIVSKYNIDLVLSGHSHNGQVNIPFIKKIFLPYGSKKYYENYYKVKNTDLYISSGIGQSRINFRLFNRPSINFYRINKITD
ncbi:MAG: metallophosphoesterase [Bacilli bacterium]|nr:metallophosphoesterase [Bacilli bacterium]